MVFLVSSFLRKKWHPCVITLCSGLNEQFPHKSWVFDYLVSHWYSCLGRCGFAKGGMSLGAQAASCMFPMNSLFPDMGSQFQLPTAVSLLCHQELQHSGTVCRTKCFLLLVTLVMVFNHSNRKVTKMIMACLLLSSSQIMLVFELVSKSEVFFFNTQEK